MGAKPAVVVIPEDLEGILEMLDPELPPIPPNPVVTQINPPGADGKGKLPRMVFGKYMDDPEGEEKKSKKKAKKKDAAAPKDKEKAEPEVEKVEEVEPFQAIEPPKHAKGTQQYDKEVHKAQAENFFPVSNHGQACNPGVAPSIIREVYYPPEASPEVTVLIESALVYQNSESFEMALDCFEKARTEWTAGQKRQSGALKQVDEIYLLYFELCIASVYEGWGKIDKALKHYM